MSKHDKVIHIISELLKVRIFWEMGFDVSKSYNLKDNKKKWSKEVRRQHQAIWFYNFH